MGFLANSTADDHVQGYGKKVKEERKKCQSLPQALVMSPMIILGRHSEDNLQF